MVGKLKILLAAFSIAISMGAWPSSGSYGKYTGPCDLITCAEAYSLTRAMKASYVGPLFQLYNGTTTLDIGQAGHRANMTTWSAFCSGNPHSCVISKIYGQINSNNLVPSSRNATGGGGPDCSTGGTYVCAANFTIDVTGLPILRPIPPAEYYVGASVGSDDTAATGITAGTSAISIVYDGVPLQQVYCCGPMGIGHKYNAADVLGTTLYPILAWGQFNGGGVGINNNCSTTTTFCSGADEESITDIMDYTPVVNNEVVGVVFDPAGSGTMTAYVNGVQLFSRSPPAAVSAGHPINLPTFIHVSGGGDLSQPNTAFMREALFSNVVLSSSQSAQISTNMNNFYNGLTSTYKGIGDIQSGATVYLGLRPYSNATIGNKAVNIRRASDNHTCDVNTSAAGLGNTAGCSTGGDNGQSASSFCNATSCFITEFYDQTGNGNNVTQATTANQPALTFNCVSPGSRPCATFNGTTQWLLAATCSISSYPLTVGHLTNRTGGLGSFAVIYTPCQTNLGIGNGLFFSNGAQIDCTDGNSTTGIAATQNIWHSATCNLPASGPLFQLVDTTSASGSSGATVFSSGAPASLGANDNGGSGTSFFNGQFTETFAYTSVLPLVTLQAFCSNEGFFYGVPAC